MLKRKKGKNKFYNSKDFYLGIAKDVTNEYGELFYDKPTYHMVGFGASGSGKTEFLKAITYQSIENDYQVIAIDPKGSASWLEAFLLAAHRKGILYKKEKGPIFFAPSYPDFSFRFNPLYKLEPYQIAEVVVAGIKEGKEPFFKEIAYEITYAIALGLYARGEKEITFSHIYEYINQTSIDNLHRLIERDLVESSKLDFKYVDDAIRVLDKLRAYDPQYFPRVNGSLRTYLTKVVTGDVGRLINVKGNMLWDRIESGNLLLFAFLNRQVLGEMAVALARILISNIQQIVGSYANRRKKIEPQLRIIIDELKQVVYKGFESAFGLFREFNVSLVGFTQSYSDLVAEVGKERTEAIMESSGCKIMFYLGSVDSQRYFSALSGKIRKPRMMVREGSIFVSYVEDSMVLPEYFEKLKPGHYIAFIQGEWYRGYMPLLKDKMHVEIVAIEDEKELERLKNRLKEKYGDFVIANLLKIAENYKSGDVKILVVDMERLKKNYVPEVKKIENEEKEDKNKKSDNKIQKKELPQELKAFEADFESKVPEGWKSLFRESLEFLSGMRGTPSVVKGANPLRHVSLVEHLLNTAGEAYSKAVNANLKEDDVMVLFFSALFHDIGKGLLDIENYDTSKHPEEGAQFFEKFAKGKIKKEYVKVIADLIRNHHSEMKDPYCAKLLEILKNSDRDVRSVEEETVKEKAITSAKVDIQKLKRDLERAAKTRYGKSQALFCKDGKIYMLWEKGERYIKGNAKHPEVLARTLNGEIVKVHSLKIDNKDVFKDLKGRVYIVFDGKVLNIAPWDSGKVEIEHNV